MGFRVRRSLKILPGIRLNFGKTGSSVSIGGRGATVNVNSRGTRTTVGLPGTGLSYSTFRPRAKRSPAEGDSALATTPGGGESSAPTPGFFGSVFRLLWALIRLLLSLAVLLVQVAVVLAVVGFVGWFVFHLASR